MTADRNGTRHRSLAPTLALAGAALALLLCLPTLSAGKSAAPDHDRPGRGRHVPGKPHNAAVRDTDQPDVIVVKFREGTHIREHGGRLGAHLERLSGKEQERRRRLPLDDAAIAAQVEQVNQLFTGPSRHHLQRLFTRTEDDLDREKEDGEASTGDELADLNLYFHILVEDADPEHAAELIDALNALDVVEIAYAEPVGEPAAVDIAPTTPSFVANQGYLGAAPAGIDADYARSTFGARGGGVKVIDIETNWTLDHEDLNPVFHKSGVLVGDYKSREHGTAVLGELAAQENGYGMTGIAPLVSTGVSSADRQICGWNAAGSWVCSTRYDVADAVNRAAAALVAGDIILVEQHSLGPVSNQACPCNCPQFEYIAVEYWPANFDAIRSATARGLVVVEAAGNGSMNLDSPIYKDTFNRAVRDSGAILVGAGTSRGGRSPECFTNYGSRVDVQGWGDGVATLGYGTTWSINGSDARQWYTATFSGTSSASPIVTGAAALIQGYRKSTFRPVLDAAQMRQVLQKTGSSQAADTKNIGPLPNVRAAIEAHGVGCTPITPGTTWASRSAFIAPNGYRDYCFTAQAGVTYTFSTCNNNARFDTVIEVRANSWSSPLAADDDGCGLQSSLVWRAPSTGAFRVRLRGYQSAYGSFTLWFRTS